MKKLLLFSAVALGLVAIVADKPIEQVKEKLFVGTLAGVNACLKANQTSLVEEEQLKVLCVTKHQKKPTYRIEYAGRALLFSDRIEGTFDNDDSSFVVTWVEVEALYFDSESKKTTLKANGTLFAMPNSQDEFVARFKNADFEQPDVQWCEKEEEKDCKTWGVTEIKGINF